MVTCLVLRRTGDLWMPLGIHSHGPGAKFTSTACQTAVIGPTAICSVPVFSGNPLLTGGGFGPEASILTLVLLAIRGMIFSVWLRGVRYPNPAAVQRAQGGSPT